MTARHQVVRSFDALLEPFTPEVNARCFERSLDFDFDGLARALATDADVLDVDADQVRALQDVDSRAVQVVLDDLARLTALGREPQLNVITRYPPDTRGLPVAVDVHSFHVDRAPIEADTFLCTYAGACSELVENESATRLVDDPAIRAALRAQHGGDGDFDAWLAEQSFDLHFAMKAGALSVSFGVGNLWRVAVDWPGAPSLPCIHRAPKWDGRPRLLLIS